MVQVVVGNSSSDFEALVYGQQHPGVVEYLRQQVYDVSHTLGEAGNRFALKAQRMFEEFNGSTAIRTARAAVRRAGNMFQRDEVRQMWEIGDIQNAPLTMQRYIMANPVVRNEFHRQRCDGYSGTYVDMEPKSVGVDHHDYRRVMSGVVEEFVNPDGEDDWKFTTYYDDELEGDAPLLFEEKVEILSTWDVVQYMMRQKKEDPTSQLGNSL